MLPESKKEIEPLIKEFKKKMKERGIPEKAIDKILELQEMNLRSKSRKIKDREERKKFEVQYFKDFLTRYERWAEDIKKAMVE
jgi:hypothetical protein